MSFTLSHDQVIAVQGICDTLLDADPGTSSIAVLTGSAGTGKSTVVAELIQQASVHHNDVHVELCATTHRAASVLQDIVGHPVQTGHAVFKLRPSVTKYGKEELKATGPCDIPHGSLVIFDEASMIGDKFLQAIVDTVQDRALKLLFVGDSYQLPPPVDRCSLFDGSLTTFTLTKVHRQNTGNPILDKAIEFREFIAGNRSQEPVLETCINDLGEGIHVLPHADFVSSFVQKYMSYDTGAEVEAPLCTFTNESAINYNMMIRKAAYFLEDTIAPFYEGERLIANSVVQHDGRTILNNNEIVTIRSFQENEYTEYSIPGHSLVVEGDYDKYTKSSIKNVFVPLNRMVADKALNELKAEAISAKNKAVWVRFYDLKNRLADLRPPFAGTTHKAQGGTFPAVFIDKTNIMKCRDQVTRARLLYVALTRASKNVYINS